MSIGRHLLRGSGANLLDHGIKIGVVFYTAPLMLHGLSEVGYGSWLLAMTVIGFFLMLDLGVTLASTRYFAMAVGSKDSVREGTVLAVSRRLFRMIGLTIFGCTMLSLPLMPWLASKSLSTWEVIAPLAICGSTTALRFACRMPMILLRAHVRYDLLAWCSIARSIIQAAVMTVALRSGFGLVGAALAHSFGDCLELGLQRLMARRLPRPDSVEISSEATRQTQRELFGYCNSMLLLNVGESFRLQVNPFLISKMCGVAEVPVYSLGMRLITMLEDVVNALFGGQVLAAFSQLHGADNQQALQDQFRRVTRLTVSFSAWAVGGLAFFGEAFFKRWMGEDFGRAHDVMLILAIPYGLRFMQYPAHNLLYAINEQRWMVWGNFIGGIVSVIFAIILVPSLGLRGVVLGTALEMSLFYLFVMPWVIAGFAKLNPLRYLLGMILQPMVLSLVLPGLYAWWALQWLTPDYGQLFLCSVGYTLVFAITVPWLALDAGMRHSLWQLFKARFRR